MKNIIKGLFLVFILAFIIVLFGCGEEKNDPKPVDPPVVDPDPTDPVEPEPTTPVDPEPTEPVEPDPTTPVDPPSTYTFNDVEKYLRDNFDGIEIDKDITFPDYLEEFKAELIWESGEDEYLTSDGKFTAPILDLENDLIVTIILNGKD